MKSTLKIQARFYTNREWIFNPRFHVAVENKFKTHEMSINFGIPNIPTEGWSKFMEFHVTIGDKFKTHEIDIKNSGSILYQPRMNF